MGRKRKSDKMLAKMEMARSKKKCIAGSTCESVVDSQSNALRSASPQGSLQSQPVLPSGISTPKSVPSPLGDAVQTQLTVLPSGISTPDTSVPSPSGDAVSINKTSDATKMNEQTETDMNKMKYDENEAMNKMKYNENETMNKMKYNETDMNKLKYNENESMNKLKYNENETMNQMKYNENETDMNKLKYNENESMNKLKYNENEATNNMKCNENDMNKVKYNENDMNKLKYNESDMNKLKYNENDMNKVKYTENDMNEVKYNEIDMNKLKYQTDMKKVKYNEIDMNKIKYNENDMNKLKYNETDMNKVKYNEIDMNKMKYNETDMDKPKHHETEMNKKKLNKTETKKMKSNETDINDLKLNENDLNDPHFTESRSNEICDIISSIQGSFDQADLIFGENGGKQCTVMSFMALTYSEHKALSEWSIYDMDKVMIDGNNLYSILQRSSTISHNYLFVDELPTELDILDSRFTYEYSNSLDIVLNGTSDDLITYHSCTLNEALKVLFDDYNACFITFADYTSIIIKHYNQFYVFDSHARDRNGLQDARSGKSVLLKINCIDTVERYVLRLLKSMNKNYVVPCEVKGVNISNARNVEINLTEKQDGIDDVTFVYEVNKATPSFFPFDLETQYKTCKLIGISLQKKLNLQCAEKIKNDFTTKSITKDGNCFFRAISYAISGTERFHEKLRESVFNYLEKEHNLFESFLRSQYIDINDYLKRSLMNKNGTWATEIEILAMSVMLSTNIYTFSCNSWLKYSPEQISETLHSNKCSIYLKHSNNNHYDIVISSTDANSKSTEEQVKCEQSSGSCESPVTVSAGEIVEKIRIESKSPKRSVISVQSKQMKDKTVTKRRKRSIISRKVKQISKLICETNEKSKYQQLYAQNEKVRKTKQEVSKQKYASNKEFRSNLMKSSKQKYASNKEFRANLIKSGKQKYSSNKEFRANVIKRGKQKYSSNKEYRANLIKSSKQKYASNKEFRANVIKGRKQKYASNKEFRANVIKRGKQKYSSNKEYRANLIKSIKHKYSSNKDYRCKLINVGKQKYSLNEEYRNKLKATSVLKYATSTSHRENVKKTNPKHKREITQTGIKRKTKAHKNINDISRMFKQEICRGPAYICSCCNRLLFAHQVLLCNENKYENKGENVKEVAKKCITKKYFHECNDTCNEQCVNISLPSTKLWICFTCHRKLLNGKVPSESVQNNLSLESIPENLAQLNSLEQHLISLHIPFMKVLALPKGGQHGVHGPVVCVPSDIKKTTDVLPRSDGNNMLLKVKLKRKLSYKGYYQYQFIDQKHVEDALVYLKQNNCWYSDITIDNNWLNPIPENNEQSLSENVEDNFDTVAFEHNSDNLNDHTSDDEFEERSNDIQLDSCLQPDDLAQHVLDEYSDEILNLAPAEGNNPIKILNEKGNEAKTFPVQFPTGIYTYNDEREERITLSRYFNTRLMNADNRFAKDTNYIFYSQYMSELQHVMSSVSIACRKSNKKTSDGTKITREMLNDSKSLKNLINSDQIYKFLNPVRGTPPYWQTAQKDLFAMLRQLGIPTWFCSFSSADTRWEEIIGTILFQQNDTRKPQNLDWNEKCTILRSNPVTAARMFDHRFHTFLNKVILSDAAPIGKVKDYFYRVEFQQRGSPHTHCLFWVENAPKFDVDDDDILATFINRYTSCKLPNEKEDPELFEIVSHVQQHSKKHSKTCRKKGTTCRFNFPRPPSKKTFICRHKADGIDNNENMSQDDAKERIQSVWKIILEGESENLTCDEIFEKAGQSQTQMQEAFHVVSQRNDIILEREPHEIWTNQYNAELLRCWNANMDIQFVLDAYACIVYVISYISKAEREMGLLLRKTKNEADEQNLDAQKTMRKLGTAYMNYREISAQESVYRVCNLRLKECSRKVQFIPVGDNPIRMRMPLKYMSAEDSDDIWMSSITDKYKLRPSTAEFEEMSLATFCSQFRILAKSQVPRSMRNESHETINRNIHKLQENSGYIQRRTRTEPAIIRYPRFSETKSPELYFQSILELFLPHRCKQQLKPHPYETYENFYNTGTVKLTKTSAIQSVKVLVDSNKQLYDINGNEIEDVERILQTAKPEDAWARLCPQTELERDECINRATSTVVEEEITNDIDLHLSNSNYSQSPKEKNPALYSKYEVQPLLCSMNKTQSKVFYKVRQWCLNEVHGRNQKPLHLFITGGAGVGKSHLIKCIYYESTRILAHTTENPDDITVLLTAPTGTAAFNIKGRTIHSALSIPLILRKYLPLKEDKLNTLRSELGKLKIIIIDEVSMVSKMLLYYISERLRQLKKTKQGTHFGNISVILVGDFYQVPPVAVGQKDLLYVNNASDAVDLMSDFSIVQLEEVMRQKDDLEFANFLNRCRVKSKNENLSCDDMDVLKQCYDNRIDDALHIYPRNEKVNIHNLERFTELDTPLYYVDAEDFVKDKRTGRLTQKNLSSSKGTNLENTLFIAEKARVMLTRNIDVLDGLVNGVIGTVVKVTPKQMFVVFDNENVGREACKKSNSFDLPINAVCIDKQEEHVAQNRQNFVRKQFPLKLAWACTIHKVQGLTLNKVVVSLDETFTPGMAYVALSRATSQSGLQIQENDRDILNKAIYCEEGISKALDDIPQFIQSPQLISPLHTSIILHNIQGLISNLPNIKGDCRFLEADYLCLTETWLTEKTVQINTAKLENFCLHQKPRCLSYNSSDSNFEALQKQRHGGVGVYVKENKIFDPLDLSIPNLEYISFFLPHVDTTVVVIYRPNTYPIGAFHRTLIFMIEKLISCKNCLIIGDFNQDILVESSVKQLFETYGYRQLVKDASTEGGTLIDHVYQKGPLDVHTEIVPTYFSYHEAISLTINV